MRWIFIAATLATFSHAEIGSDKIAHVGVSGAIVTGVYFTMSAFTGRDPETKLPALIGATVMGMAVGLAGELMDAGERPAGQRYIDGGDMAANLVGVGLAAGLIYFLDVKGATPTPQGVAFRF